jgi:hypothetical protein
MTSTSFLWLAHSSLDTSQPVLLHIRIDDSVPVHKTLLRNTLPVPTDPKFVVSPSAKPFSLHRTRALVLDQYLLQIEPFCPSYEISILPRCPPPMMLTLGAKIEMFFFCQLLSLIYFYISIFFHIYVSPETKLWFSHIRN